MQAVVNTHLLPRLFSKDNSMVEKYTSGLLTRVGRGVFRQLNAHTPSWQIDICQEGVWVSCEVL